VRLGQLLALGLLCGLSWAAGFNVRTYGAKGDRTTKDTAAIQKAIDECNRAGGGQVYFPAGNYLSGTLFLKSNVTLFLSPGATLWGSTRQEDYNPKHLIYASDAENITIEGSGTIDGQGGSFVDKDFNPLSFRPSPLIELVRCKRVRIQDVTISNAPAWCIHPMLCEHVKIRGINILSDMRIINTDGIDPDSSRNVMISDCYIQGGDDSIVLKTMGRTGSAPPCENVTVTNCVLVSSASALKLGTESRGDFRHCVFSNCVIRDSRTGIALFAKDGGTFENISFSNITIQTKPKLGKGNEWPILVDIERRTRDSRLSRIRDVNFSDIQLVTKGRVMVTGMPERPVEDITFRNVVMRVIGFENIAKTHKARGGRTEQVKTNIDLGATPAAFILGYVRGITLRGVRVIWDTQGEPQERHAIYADSVEGLRVDDFTGRQAVPGGKLGALLLKNTKSVSIMNSEDLK
jgi:hypothetical protein